MNFQSKQFEYISLHLLRRIISSNFHTNLTIQSVSYVMNNSIGFDMHPRLLHTKDYLVEFDTEAYLSAYMFFEMIPSFNQLLREIVRIFIENKQRLGRKSALEFGGGPTLFSSFILAQYVDSIHFTDYTPSNLKAIEDWINQAEHAHDWTDLFENIIHEYQQQAS